MCEGIQQNQQFISKVNDERLKSGFAGAAAEVEVRALPGYPTEDKARASGM